MNLFNKLKEKKLLLVDDDEWIRASLSLFFKCEGCHMQTVESAEEGMDILESQAYDIIIADYRLPGMDGLQFFKRIQEKYPDTIKILITAYGSEEIVSEAHRIGVHDFIEKPFSSDDLEASLSQFFEQSEEEKKSYVEYPA